MLPFVHEKCIPGNVLTTNSFEYFEFICLQFTNPEVSKFSKILKKFRQIKFQFLKFYLTKLAL